MKMNFRNFWMYYSYSIVRIFVDQIVIAIFALAVALGTAASVGSLGAEKSNVLTIVTSVFSILFFLFMVGELCFKQGAADKEKTDVGRFERDDLTGLYMGLLANIPNFILTLGYTVFYFIDATRGSVSGFFGLAVKLICGEYLGLFSIKIGGDTLSTAYPYIYFLAILPCVFAAWLGYYLGISGKIIIKPTKKDLE